MYKDMEVAQRAKAIERLAFQLDVLNRLVKGPYVGGDHLGLADAALFPTLTFMRFILPQFFGWDDLFAKRQQLGQYWAAIEADLVGAKVCHPFRPPAGRLLVVVILEYCTEPCDVRSGTAGHLAV